MGDQEVLLELYAGGRGYQGSGEVHVLVRDAESLEKIKQIEISTEAFDDYIHYSYAFIEYYDGHAFVAYTPIATDQDASDGIVTKIMLAILMR